MTVTRSLHPVNDRSGSLDSDVMNHLNTKRFRHIRPAVIDANNIEHADPRCRRIDGQWWLVEEETALYRREQFCPLCHPYGASEDDGDTQ